MSPPVRVQLRRTKGWRMPENTVKVDRTTRFGNPFTPFGCAEAGYKGTAQQLAHRCVEAFRIWIDTPYWRENWQGEESEKARARLLEALPGLRGKNLASGARLICHAMRTCCLRWPTGSQRHD